LQNINAGAVHGTAVFRLHCVSKKTAQL